MDTSLSLSWQLLNRLFSGPLEAPFIQEIIGLPTDHMVAPGALERLMAALEQWRRNPGVQEAAGLCYQRLFLGPEASPAPPWGSVYLTPDNTTMGPSTLAIRREFQKAGVVLATQGGEPDDHFAHCCAFLSLLSQEGDPAPAREFFRAHLLPWGPRFLELMVDHCQDPVYEAIAQYAMAVLETVGGGMEPPGVKLYL